MKTIRYALLWSALALPSLMHAQLDPASAEVFSYFPQIADGGGPAQKWITSFTFTNPDSAHTAGVTLFFYDNNGQALALDLGNGPTTSPTFNVAPQATVTFTTAGASGGVTTGWAMSLSSMPLQSVARYQYSVNGAWQQGVSVPATPATFEFMSPVTAESGIALANPWGSRAITVTVSLYGSQGNNISSYSVNLAPMGHASFNLLNAFSSLPSNFRGSVQISSGSLPNNMNYFTALVLSGDGGVLSSYPSGAFAWPASEYQRVWKVWEKVLNQALTLFPVIAHNQPALTFDSTVTAPNAHASWPANTVTIDDSLAELLSDSDSELAFVIAHEVGHIIQYQSGKLSYVPADAEWDADVYGWLLSMTAGYDPYAVGGAFGKLMMANGTASLEAEQALASSTDAHGSFNTRIANIFADIQALCQQPSMASSCATLKSAFHPHLPSMDPMMKRGQATAQNTNGAAQ